MVSRKFGCVVLCPTAAAEALFAVLAPKPAIPAKVTANILATVPRARAEMLRRLGTCRCHDVNDRSWRSRRKPEWAMQRCHWWACPERQSHRASQTQSQTVVSGHSRPPLPSPPQAERTVAPTTMTRTSRYDLPLPPPGPWPNARAASTRPGRPSTPTHLGRDGGP